MKLEITIKKSKDLFLAMFGNIGIDFNLIFKVFKCY